MIFVDKPYISDLFRQTILDNSFPVVKTEMARELGFHDEPYFLDEDEAIKLARSSKDIRIYTTSENSISWIAQHLSFTDLPEKIDLFKNKARFREMISPMYPDFYFQEVTLGDLDSLDIEEIPLPFVIKPAVGFFSMAVYKVAHPGQWEGIKESINAEIQRVQHLYPREVMNTSTFIIEQCIVGDEFAIDAYYDAAGEPVILNIYNHIFSSDTDVSDRVYISSKEIIESNIDEFREFLGRVGELSGVKNFPMHVEIRRDGSGILLPIEINPMRFGGWCTTADLTCFAYGFNPYKYYFSQKRPDWPAVLKDKDGKLYSIIVLDNSTGVDGDRITSFDYDTLLSRFEHPLDFRRIDYKQYPVFGFLFTETQKDRFSELEAILSSDLKEFISAKV